MDRFSLPFTQFIHESLSVIMTFCFSRVAIEQIIEARFQGEWKYLEKGLFDVSEKRAKRACLELALYLRLLDDEEDMSRYLRQTETDIGFGRLVFSDKPDRELMLREVANKIIHASELQWDFATEEKPVLICMSREQEKWKRAEIDVVSLAAFCGQLMH